MKESLFAEPAQGPFCEERSRCCETTANNLTGRPTVPAVQPGGLPPEDIPAADAGYEYLDDAYGEVAAAWYDPADIPVEPAGEAAEAAADTAVEPVVWYAEDAKEQPQEEDSLNTMPYPAQKEETVSGPEQQEDTEEKSAEKVEPEPPVYYWSRG